MKKLFYFIFIFLNIKTNLAQTTIFSESCGNPSVTTLISTYTGWQNNGVLTFTGNADVRNTVPSSTYTGASGLGNVFITNVLNTNVTISGINTANYTNLVLSFGHVKTTNASNGTQMAVEVSTDGTAWTALTFSVPTGGGTANVWRLVTPTGSIPSTTNLRIRFRMATVTTGLQFRVDDIKLVGCLIPSAPTYTINNPACQSATLTFPSSTFLQTIATDTTRNSSSPQVLTTSGTRYLRTVSTVAGCTSVWSTATSVPVNIIGLPTVSKNPTNAETSNNLSATFIASSANNFYWQKSTDSINWTPVDFVKRDTLILYGVTISMNKTFYRIATSNSPCNDTVYSTAAKLTVYQWPLPVKLIYFESVPMGEYISLKWATATEIDNEKFIIERSTDCYSWEIIGEVKGVGYSSSNVNYIFNDIEPINGLSYYRLKQIDFDNDYEYFNPISSFFKNKIVLKKYYNINGIQVDKVETNGIYFEVDGLTVRKIMLLK